LDVQAGVVEHRRMTPIAMLRPSRTARSIVRVALAAVVLATAVTVVGPASNPAPASAGTAEYMEGLILKWINSARSARGVPALSTTWRLVDLAGDRARSMASAGRLYHPSCLSCLLRSRSISFSTCAEVIAYTSYPWGYDAARSIFLRWKGSSGHWGILMSRSYTRIGIGVAYRSSNRTTWAAGILIR
jgi:uncharacterized protein YkwD